MWTFILAETDDDHEWIPNPRQTGSLGIPVNQEMIDTWRTTLKEAERVIKGQQLVPFWRDFLGPNQRAVRGIDVRAVVQNPPERLRILLWIQGTEATAYLREGEITMFADRDFLNRLRRVYGANLFGFAARFNLSPVLLKPVSFNCCGV